MTIKLLRWIIFSVVVALVPLIFNYLRLETRGHEVAVFEVIENGELMLIVAALCAASIGGLIGSSGAFQPLKIAAGGGATVSLMVAALYYADVSAARYSEAVADPASVATVSLTVFLLALVSSGACVALSEI